jgi:hypothetical protein
MTVLEAFAKAFGPLPEGVTEAHVGNQWDGPQSSTPFFAATVRLSKGNLLMWREANYTPSWSSHCYKTPVGPNIADRSAESFRGFFGDRYDAVLDEPKVIDGVNVPRGWTLWVKADGSVELRRRLEHGLYIGLPGYVFKGMDEGEVDRWLSGLDAFAESVGGWMPIPEISIGNVQYPEVKE